MQIPTRYIGSNNLFNKDDLKEKIDKQKKRFSLLRTFTYNSFFNGQTRHNISQHTITRDLTSNMNSSKRILNLGRLNNLYSSNQCSTNTYIGSGILDILPSGNGFLRVSECVSSDDIYITGSLIQTFKLKNGAKVIGEIRSPKSNESHYVMIKLIEYSLKISNNKFFAMKVPVYTPPCN